MALEFLSRLGWLSAVLLLGCAGTLRPDDQVRESIHFRHAACMETADTYAAQHGEDSFRYLWCDAWADRRCHDAGLEHNCSQWVGGH